MPPTTPDEAVVQWWRLLNGASATGGAARLAALRLVGERTGDAVLVLDATSDGEATLLARGDRAALEATGGDASATTWTEEVLEAADELEVRVAGHAGGEPWMPLLAGVARVGALVRGEVTAVPGTGAPGAASGQPFAPRDQEDAAHQALEAPAAAPVRVRLHLSSGESLDVEGPVLIGRAPTAPAGQAARLVCVASPRGGIARTHTRVEVRGARVLVTDLATTNGVLVRHPRRLPFRPQAGVATEVGHGAVVELADGVSFRVEVGQR
ncbi:FHA domain-containing protein [Serinibacter salmoneus]|uniref:FHA domain-containing protein n=1 Tax=Serinibacter salmoneus TaxID=556530 RepID=UPI00117B280B|nr:FHA domain-containing protein [Serinibacter salmoneus]